MPDEARADGFTNSVVGLVVTADHADGFFYLAELVAQAVPNWSDFVDSHTSCKTLGDTSCEQAFVASLGAKLFRRPLNDGEVTRFAALFAIAAEEDATFEEAARLILEGMLQAPQFLYQLEDELVTNDASRTVAGYEMATRLSYLIWQSAPDNKLYEAAAAGLDTRDSVVAQADRMLSASLLPQRATERFVRDWFGLDALKNSEREDLTNEMAFQLLNAAVATYQEHVWNSGQPLSDVLTSQQAHLPSFAAEWYGLTPGGAGVEAYDLDSVPERVSILTHPGVLTAISDRDVGGIVARGLFVMEHLHCRQALTPPPDLNTPTSSRTWGRTPPSVTTPKIAWRMTAASHAICV